MYFEQEAESPTRKAMLPLLVPYITTRAVVWIACFIGAIGIGISLFTGDWDNFARSGPLIVVCALLLALFDYTSSTKQVSDKTRDILGMEYSEDEKKRINPKYDVRDIINGKRCN